MSKRQSISDNLAKAASNRAEEEAQYRRRYGDLLPDVLLLQKRGFVIDKVRGGYRVGNKVMTREELLAKAARERRLAGAGGDARKVLQTASGLRVGDSVSIGVKATCTASRQTPKLPAAMEKLTGAALAAKQKAEQASDDLGPAPRLDWLPLTDLSIDRRYQREMGKGNWAHANRIMREWNWLHYQPIVVAPAAEGGGFMVIDGQHRLEAARKHPRIDRLPCYIVEAGDVALQAEAFVALNARRIGVTRLQRFWAAHAAGDKVAARVHRICADAGVTIARSAGVLPPRTTYATFTIEKLLPLGSGPVRTALQVLAETHGQRHDAFKSPLIFGLTQICAGKVFSRPRLVQALRGTDLNRLIADAKSWQAENRGTLEKATERALRQRYEAARVTA